MRQKGIPAGGYVLLNYTNIFSYIIYIFSDHVFHSGMKFINKTLLEKKSFNLKSFISKKISYFVFKNRYIFHSR